MLAIFFAACSDRATGPTPPPVENAPAESAHAATPHEHASPHGGMVQSTPHGHIELLVDRAGRLRAWLLDEELRPRPPAAASGTARVGLPGYAEIALAAAGDHLEGAGPPFARADFPVVVTAIAAGAPETARFAAHLDGPHHHAHPDGGASGPDSIIGQIVDSSCLARGESPSADHAACAIRCIRGGAPIAIVEDGTGQVYIAVGADGKSATELLLPLIGRRSELFGRIARLGGAQLFLVDEAVPEHDHRAREGGSVAMVGETHLEVTALRSGEVRVYLSDAFRKPLPVAGRRGVVEARVAGELRSADLTPAGDHLAARLPPLGPAPVEATVRLPMDGDPNYFVTFLLDVKSAESNPLGQNASKPPIPQKGEVRIEVAGEYKPSRIVLKRNVPAHLRFIRRDDSACTSEVVLFGKRTKLAPLAETVVDVTPDRAGHFEFTCGMNMLHGEIEVQE